MTETRNDNSTQYILEKSVDFRTSKDGGILYYGRKAFLLNSVAALILNGIIKGKSKKKILADIQKEYEVNNKMASEDYDSFVTKLIDEGLLLKKEVVSNGKAENSKNTGRKT
jgi:Coenzyme PQQ synthesis protein D (PqqD).